METMPKNETELVEEIQADGLKRTQSTPYVGQASGGSHHKTAVERSLVLKADLVILPLVALVYFVSYIVSLGSSILQ